MTDHAQDHDRLAAAHAAWVATGRKRTGAGPAGNAARTLGLRITAHLAVVHHRNDLNAKPTDPVGFDVLLARHDDLHNRKG